MRIQLCHLILFISLILSNRHVSFGYFYWENMNATLPIIQQIHSQWSFNPYHLVLHSQLHCNNGYLFNYFKFHCKNATIISNHSKLFHIGSKVSLAQVARQALKSFGQLIKKLFS